MNEHIMRTAGFGADVNKVNAGYCPTPTCERTVEIEDFRDEISRRDFEITGLCQACQDEIYGDSVR